ncbi:class I SAM-dependent methyltransferase [Actinopolymorpha cephalotaxi]
MSVPPTHRALEAIDRFNRAHPWDHNAHYHRWILRRLPRRFGTAVDVGCGRGELARLLAERSEAVDGIDSDPQIIAAARESTAPGARVSFSAGDALTDVPPGSFDVITCVATVHHLPFAEAIGLFRRRLAPGGTLVIVGLYEERTLGDHLLGAASVPLNLVIGLLKNTRALRRNPGPASMAARTRPAGMTFADITRQARAALPGVRLRRRLFWRYTLVWHRPSRPASGRGRPTASRGAWSRPARRVRRR